MLGWIRARTKFPIQAHTDGEEATNQLIWKTSCGSEVTLEWRRTSQGGELAETRPFKSSSVHFGFLPLWGALHHSAAHRAALGMNIARYKKTTAQFFWIQFISIDETHTRNWIYRRVAAEFGRGVGQWGSICSKWLNGYL